MVYENKNLFGLPKQSGITVLGALDGDKPRFVYTRAFLGGLGFVPVFFLAFLLDFFSLFRFSVVKGTYRRLFIGADSGRAMPFFRAAIGGVLFVPGIILSTVFGLLTVGKVGFIHGYFKLFFGMGGAKIVPSTTHAQMNQALSKTRVGESLHEDDVGVSMRPFNPNAEGGVYPVGSSPASKQVQETQMIGGSIASLLFLADTEKVNSNEYGSNLSATSQRYGESTDSLTSVASFQSAQSLFGDNDFHDCIDSDDDSGANFTHTKSD